MSNPLVSIVVLNWNGENIFPPCLESLAKTEYQPYEVIFFDNGSSDASIKIAKKFDVVRVIENDTNLGYAAGNNKAAKFLSPHSKYVCFLNNDVAVTPMWLNDAISHLERDERIGVIACRNMSYYDKGIIDGLYHFINPNFTFERFGHGLPFINDPLYTELGFVAGALGASAIYRTSLFLSIGGFDESFFAYYEDADLCMRINNSGYRCLYVPTAVVYHMDQASFKKNSLRSFYYGERNRLFFMRKNFPPSFLCRQLLKIIREDAIWIKAGLLGRRSLGTFLMARIDSLRQISSYRFSMGGQGIRCALLSGADAM